MYLMGLEITIRLFDSYSLKDKRQVVKSIVDKGQHKFKISVAEVGAYDLHNQALIGFGIVTNSNRQGEQVLNQVIRFVEETYPVEITSISWI